MTEKRVINSKSTVNINKVNTTEKKSAKPETKIPQSPVENEKQSEQPVMLRNKMQVVPYVEKKSEKDNMEELYRKMKTEMPKVVPVAKDFKPSEHSQRCLANQELEQPFIGPINKPDIPKEAIIGPVNKPNLIEKSPLHFTSKTIPPSQNQVGAA